MSTSTGRRPPPHGDEPGEPESSVGSAALADAAARLGLESALLLHAAAERMGIAVTDLSCLLLLLLEGPAAAGRLAVRTGLTTGAITGVVDRLVRAGWVQRDIDPEDRRRVVVRLRDDRRAGLWLALAPVLGVAAGIEARIDGAPTSVLDVVRAVTDAFGAELDRVRRPADDVGLTGGPASRAALRLLSWSGPLLLQSVDLGNELARGSGGAAGGYPPGQTWSGGRVSVAPNGGRHRVVPMTGPALEVHSAVTWDVEVAGGANRLHLDLRAVRLGGLVIGGGANRVELQLPRPAGAVTIKVGGGANRLRISRPPGVPVNVAASAGVAGVRVDGVRVRALGNGWPDPPVTDAGTERYQLEVSGGASRVVID